MTRGADVVRQNPKSGITAEPHFSLETVAKLIWKIQAYGVILSKYTMATLYLHPMHVLSHSKREEGNAAAS